MLKNYLFIYTFVRAKGVESALLETKRSSTCYLRLKILSLPGKERPSYLNEILCLGAVVSIKSTTQ